MALLKPQNMPHRPQIDHIRKVFVSERVELSHEDEHGLGTVGVVSDTIP